MALELHQAHPRDGVKLNDLLLAEGLVEKLAEAGFSADICQVKGKSRGQHFKPKKRVEFWCKKEAYQLAVQIVEAAGWQVSENIKPHIGRPHMH